MSKQRAIGTVAESAVARVFQQGGWPLCERRALHGAADLGDLTGIVGLCVEVKGGETARGALNQPALIQRWLFETETERRNAHADIGLLVIQRGRFGARNAHRWWVVVPWRLLRDLDTSHPLPTNGYPDWIAPIFMELGALLPVLRLAGYGDPPCTHPEDARDYDLNEAADFCTVCGDPIQVTT